MTPESPSKVIITVVTQYLPEASTPLEGQYRFKYTVTIDNQTNGLIQIMGRRWQIHHSLNHVELVGGLGVVGAQPVLEAGASFTYESSAVLLSEQGTMAGFYVCIDEQGYPFEVPIPEFLLSALEHRH
jgi:ApaG protein